MLECSHFLQSLANYGRRVWRAPTQGVPPPLTTDGPIHLERFPFLLSYSLLNCAQVCPHFSAGLHSHSAIGNSSQACLHHLPARPE